MLVKCWGKNEKGSANCSITLLPSTLYGNNTGILYIPKFCTWDEHESNYIIWSQMNVNECHSKWHNWMWPWDKFLLLLCVCVFANRTHEAHKPQVFSNFIFFVFPTEREAHTESGHLSWPPNFVLLMLHLCHFDFVNWLLPGLSLQEKDALWTQEEILNTHHAACYAAIFTENRVFIR